MGARKNGAREGDSSVSLTRPVFPCAHDLQAPASQATLSIVPHEAVIILPLCRLPYTFIYSFIDLFIYFVKTISDK